MEKMVKTVSGLDFWRGKRVFVTGHTGFKGSWLSLWLINNGAILKGYSLEPSTKPSLFKLAGLDADMQSEIGDVNDLPSLRKSISTFRPDIVIHMAAQPLVQASYADPVNTYLTNVMGTVNLLEAIRGQLSIRAVINVTTDKCYENREWEWGYRENDAMGGEDPYSNSKACAELVTSCYRKSFFDYPDSPSIATARAGNVIGGGDWADDRLIPDIIRSFQAGEAVSIRNPHATRPWQHVLEPLAGYLKLAEKLYCYGNEFSGGWNFGPSDSNVQTVSSVVGQLAKHWQAAAGWAHDKAPHNREAQLLKLDISKATSKLLWRPVWSLEETLDHVVSWYDGYMDGADVRDLCMTDINKFEEVREQL